MPKVIRIDECARRFGMTFMSTPAAKSRMEKIQLMGDMGRQELGNVPGLLIHLLQDDSRLIPGRAQSKASAALKRRVPKSAYRVQPGRTGKWPAELNQHDYLDTNQTAKLEALGVEEKRRVLQKELDERQTDERLSNLLAGIYKN